MLENLIESNWLLWSFNYRNSQLSEHFYFPFGCPFQFWCCLCFASSSNYGPVLVAQTSTSAKSARYICQSESFFWLRGHAESLWRLRSRKPFAVVASLHTFSESFSSPFPLWPQPSVDCWDPLAYLVTLHSCQYQRGLRSEFCTSSKDQKIGDE